MAAPARLTPPAFALAGAGTFAAAVVDVLADGPTADRFRMVADPSYPWSHETLSARPNALVLVTDALSDDVAEAADEAAYRSRIPWLAVELEHQRATVGPLVVPGQGPCHACFRRRRIQHDAQWSLTRALRAARVRDEATRPTGFLPHHARIVAGVAARLLDSVTDPNAAGSVITVQLNRATAVRDMVVGCHGCTRCGTVEKKPARDLGMLLGLRENEGAVRAD